MYRDASYVVAVSFKSMDAFESIIIEYSDLHVVRTSDDPIFASNKFGCPYGNITDFESFDESLTFVIPDVDMALIEGTEHPWLRGMEIDAFDSVGPCGQLAFDV